MDVDAGDQAREPDSLQSATPSRRRVRGRRKRKPWPNVVAAGLRQLGSGTGKTLGGTFADHVSTH